MTTPDDVTLTAGRIEAARHHADWMRIGNFEDSRDSGTGYRRSSLFRVADFGTTVSERAVSWTRPKTGRPKPVFTYDWHVDRQRTEREPTPLDRSGQPKNWETRLAHGEEPTMAAARSAALKAMKQLRAEHIARGGDVGYGDAPTGDEIRAAANTAHSHGPRAAQAAAKHPGEAKEGAEAPRTPHGLAAVPRPDTSAAPDQVHPWRWSATAAPPADGLAVRPARITRSRLRAGKDRTALMTDSDSRHVAQAGADPGDARHWHEVVRHLVRGHGAEPNGLVSAGLTLDQLRFAHADTHLALAIIATEPPDGHAHPSPLDAGHRLPLPMSYVPFRSSPSCKPEDDPIPAPSQTGLPHTGFFPPTEVDPAVWASSQLPHWLTSPAADFGWEDRAEWLGITQATRAEWIKANADRASARWLASLSPPAVRRMQAARREGDLSQPAVWIAQASFPVANPLSRPGRTSLLSPDSELRLAAESFPVPGQVALPTRGSGDAAVPVPPLRAAGPAPQHRPRRLR